MKFLVDAQLPYRLAKWLESAGHDALHSSKLPRANRTSDADLCSLADDQGRVMISKDEDFVDSHVLSGRPAKLLLVSTGNISNPELKLLFARRLTQIEEAFRHFDFVELGRQHLIGRGARTGPP